MARIARIAHNDQIEWPNGMGYTPCTTAYADAIWTLQETQREMAHANKQQKLPDDYAEIYERYYRAEMAVTNLQVQGHQGKGCQY